MLLAILVFLVASILAQCAPLANREGSSASSSLDEFSSSLEHPTSNSITSKPSSMTSLVTTKSAPQPEIEIFSDGSESIFIIPAPSDNSSNSGSAQHLPTLLMGYFTCWSSMPPDQINYTNYDWIDFAFATVDANQQIFFPDSSCAVRLKQVVQNAHAQGKHAKLSIGGWEGSQYFSSGVSSPTSRQTLVNSVAAVIENFTLDGIDFDWEYPGRQGLGGNQVDPADSDNFFLFLQLLRSSISRGIKITAAVSQTPFVGRDGHPMKDVAQFAKVLDWITLMNYDVWQSSPSPGPNAPLSDGCHNSSQPEASAASAIKQWSAAGFPEAQQVLGVPFYGYLSDSTVTRLRSRDSNVPSRALADDGNRTGSVMFGNLVKQGILALVWSSSGKPTFSGAGEFRRYWDACSSTPYLRSQVTNQVIAYDDPESLDMKVQLVKGTGLKGINSWSLDGDYQGILGSNMRRAL